MREPSRAHGSHGEPHGRPARAGGPGRDGARQDAAPEGAGSGEAACAAHAERLERLEAKVSELEDQRLRMLADFDNAKKRLDRERETFIRYAAERVILALLPIMDSLGQALVAVERHADPRQVVAGVHLIYQQLLGLLDREGVKRIPTVGSPFDPHRHEAVGEVEGDGETAEGTIVEEVQVGYTMHDKVIRPAMVKVAKKNSPQSTVHGPQSKDNGQNT